MSAARSSITSRGHDSRAIRVAISDATDAQPSYFRACTMLDAGSIGIQQRDRAARTNGGRSSHQRHTSVDNGWPQRGHCGDASSGSRDQHRLQTSPVSTGDMSLSHETQTRGSNRSSAPATKPRTGKGAKRVKPVTAASPPDPALAQTTF